MRIIGQAFANEAVTLDGREFDGCRFVNCKIIYNGEGPTALKDNTLEDCELVLEGSARLTMEFLKGMSDSSDGFLLAIIRALNLDPQRLDRLKGEAVLSSRH